ncbi:unnamed protein product [Acanthoscelides obtectus]|uniref:Uncharacterized protein n=1 Tax=Acanthoscelides obtectus TaxID=200917 RepID=A0A9P0PM81_ACAOB|nr:unnamed protein product [Acanthoscelides obtectus]CAK1638300.1 hypothetical protein AOBTE_LOCUS10515 [Acanthoscelides obtectus]
MKFSKTEDGREDRGQEVRRRTRRIRHHRKICELQAELEHEDAVPHDAEAAGYSACALETLRFLSAQGLPHDHPMVKRIREKLLKEHDK